MPRNVGFSLSGKSNSSLLKLTGNKSNFECMIEPMEIKKLKINVMNTIIIPFNNKNWKVLEENLIFIDKIKEKLFLYTNKYPNIDLTFYSDSVDAYENNIYLHMEVVHLEKQLYRSIDGTSTMYVKTVMMKLNAEIELYNLIIGRPNKLNGEIYNQTILDNIIKLLQIEDITFTQIEEIIKKMI